MSPPSSTRVHVVQLLQKEPGASTRALALALGMSESTADYHLRRLKRAGQAVADPWGRELAWFPNGCGFCPLQRVALPAFRRPSVAAVARALDEQARSAADVATRAGTGVGEVRWAAQLLEAAGVAERSPSGRIRLREGAETCVARALAREPCGLWGACAPSRAPPPPARER